MILSRTSFQLHFGQARPAIAIWKEIMTVEFPGATKPTMRLLTDLSGPNYTLVAELGIRSFMDIAPGNHVWLTHPRIRELYPKFVPLCLSSTTEMYHIEHQVGEIPSPGNIIEQMTFRMKFGQIKEGCAIWRQILDIGKETGLKSRMLTDVTGESYTLQMEQVHRNMMEYGPHMGAWLSNDKLKELYAKFIPLCDRSRRRLYKVEHTI
jgi:hypothetical protein